MPQPIPPAYSVCECVFVCVCVCVREREREYACTSASEVMVIYDTRSLGFDSAKIQIHQRNNWDQLPLLCLLLLRKTTDIK